MRGIRTDRGGGPKERGGIGWNRHERRIRQGPGCGSASVGGSGCNREGDKGDTPHAGACGIAGANGRVGGRQDFSKAGGPRCKIFG